MIYEWQYTDDTNWVIIERFTIFGLFDTHQLPLPEGEGVIPLLPLGGEGRDEGESLSELVIRV